jgi:hypothetical protein
MPKIFPFTADGSDQLSIEFDYDEERKAFESGVKKISALRSALFAKETNLGSYVYELKDGRETISNTKKNLLTSLEYEVIQRKSSEVRAIIGTHVCNVFGRDSIHLTNWVKKETKP